MSPSPTLPDAAAAAGGPRDAVPPPSLPRRLLANVLGWPTLAVVTVLSSTVGILYMWLLPRRRAESAYFAAAQWWARWWLRASGMRWSMEGTAPSGSAIYVANHVSWLDIPALLLAMPPTVRFAAKNSLFRIPLFGSALRAGGFLPVDRDDRSRARDTFASGREHLARGGAVLFFPEGTRSSDGELLPFQRGAFLMALKSQLPVVPVGVEGTYRALPRHRWCLWPGPVTVRVGEPLSSEDYGRRDRQRLMDDAQAEVARLAGLELQPPEEGPTGTAGD